MNRNLEDLGLKYQLSHLQPTAWSETIPSCFRVFTYLTELGGILKEVSPTFFNLFLTLILTKTPWHSNVFFLFSDILCKVIFRNITLQTNRWINRGTNMVDSLYTLCDIAPLMSCMLYFRLFLRFSDHWCRKTFLYLAVFFRNEMPPRFS